jgi:hypothetical protein
MIENLGIKTSVYKFFNQKFNTIYYSLVVKNNY